MVPVRELLYAVRDTFDQWMSLRLGDVHFDQTWIAVLVLVVLTAIAGLMLLARGLVTNKAGRTHVALPALLPVMRGSRFSLLRHAAFLVFLLGVPFFAVALADPHTAFTQEQTSYPGRRIALLVDGSSSMVMKFETKTLKTPENRAFYTAVAAAEHFMKLRMNGRYHDLIALIQFGNEAYVVTPFTTDYENILLSIRLISSPKEWGSFNDWGTTIMQGLNQATQLFRAFDFVNAAGNAMVMFTDGRDDEKDLKGKPIQNVIDEMKKYKIPVYMVRTGYDLREGQIPTDKLWKGIVEQTGGKFYAADNEDAILKAEADIDRLATGRIDVREYTAQRPRFDGYALMAIALWLTAGVMKLGFKTFRTFP
jgi:Ca-activated chloride channel family protein